MYRSFFGLQASAFQATPDPRFLCVTPEVREALACLYYGIAVRKGFVVMTGEVGTGKTTLLKSVIRCFPKDRISTCFVFNPRLNTLDFLEFVLADFGIPAPERTKSGMLLALSHWLIQRYRENGLCVIMVDEAQNLTEDLLEEIRLLTNLETSSEKLLQIVLSGQPELEEKLRLQSLRQLRQRIALWCRTRPLNADETNVYIKERLRIAGSEELIFSPEAVQLIHELSNGIPRLINLLCENCMINAVVEQIKPIPARIVESIAADFELLDQPFLVSRKAPARSHEDLLTERAGRRDDPFTNSAHPHEERSR
jgi:general secretion pathway protein A